MKTLLTTILCAAGFVVLAQPNHHHMGPNHDQRPHMALNPEQQATIISKKMTLELDLNETQQNQVYDLILEKSKDHQKRVSKDKEQKPSKDTKYQRQVEHLDNEIEMQKAMKTILSQDQYEKWLEMNKKRGHKKQRQRRQKNQKKNHHNKKDKACSSENHSECQSGDQPGCQSKQ